jgi:hypothetical protein
VPFALAYQGKIEASCVYYVAENPIHAEKNKKSFDDKVVHSTKCDDKMMIT